MLTALVHALQDHQSSGLSCILRRPNSNQRTCEIQKLLEDRLIQAVAPNAGRYTLVLANSYLRRGGILSPTREGFIPAPLTPPS